MREWSKARVDCLVSADQPKEALLELLVFFKAARKGYRDRFRVCFFDAARHHALVAGLDKHGKPDRGKNVFNGSRDLRRQRFLGL